MQQSCSRNLFYCDINGDQKGQSGELWIIDIIWDETPDMWSHHLKHFSHYSMNSGSEITACQSVDDCWYETLSLQTPPNPHEQ